MNVAVAELMTILVLRLSHHESLASATLEISCTIGRKWIYLGLAGKEQTKHKKENNNLRQGTSGLVPEDSCIAIIS